MEIKSQHIQDWKYCVKYIKPCAKQGFITLLNIHIKESLMKEEKKVVLDLTVRQDKIQPFNGFKYTVEEGLKLERTGSNVESLIPDVIVKN